MANILLSLLFLFPFVQPAESMFGLGHGIFIANKGAVSGRTTPAFSPFSIVGSTVTNWYKADSGVTNTGDNTNATAWADNSTLADNLTVTTGNTPKYYTNIQNSLPAVLFDGAGEMGGGLRSAVEQPQTWFIVFKPTSWGTGTYQVLFAGNFSGCYSYQQFYKNTGDATTTLFALNASVAGDSLSSNNTYLETGVINGATSSTTINAGTTHTGSVGSYNTGIYTRMASDGGCCYYAGYIMEVLIYHGALTPTDIAAVKSYLNGRWAIY